MPLYTYECQTCCKKNDLFRSIADSNRPVDCLKNDCDGVMLRITTPVRINSNFLGSTKNPGYKCPVTGEYVQSANRRRAIIDEHRLVEVGSEGGFSDHEAMRKEQKERVERAVKRGEISEFGY